MCACGTGLFSETGTRTGARAYPNPCHGRGYKHTRETPTPTLGVVVGIGVCVRRGALYSRRDVIGDRDEEDSLSYDILVVIDC